MCCLFLPKYVPDLQDEGNAATSQASMRFAVLHQILLDEGVTEMTP